MFSPKSFCCIAQLMSFVSQHTRMHSAVAPQKPMLSSMLPTRRTPPVRYTGGPGTGGSKNMPTPSATNATRTTAGENSFMTEIIHPRNKVAPFPTPTSQMK